MKSWRCDCSRINPHYEKQCLSCRAWLPGLEKKLEPMSSEMYDPHPDEIFFVHPGDPPPNTATVSIPEPKYEIGKHKRKYQLKIYHDKSNDKKSSAEEL